MQTGETIALTHVLDTSGAYRLELIWMQDGCSVCARVQCNPEISTTGGFERALPSSLELYINGHLVNVSPTAEYSAPVTLDITPSHHKFPVKIRIGGVTMCKYLLDALSHTVDTIFAYKLLPHEVRIIADGGTPDPRPSLKTDLHTHLSGAIPAADLIRMGKEKPVLYPLNLLEKLDIQVEIDYMADAIVQVPKDKAIYTLRYYPEDGDLFLRVPMNALSIHALAKIQAAMCVPVDARITFPMLEEIYAYRTPISKDVSLFKSMLWAVARDYQKQGIEYVEHSMTELFSPTWLKIIHEEMPRIIEETGVDMRFLMAIPRGFKPEQIQDRIEQYKILSRSPWITGIDILAHEKNPTSYLLPYLDPLAAWMETNDPEATIRIHAGENPIFPDNVKDAVKLAERHNIYLRIGHGLYGSDDDTISFIQQINAKHSGCPHVIVEANMNSNMALNVSEFPMYPFLRYMEKDIPMVLGTDGGNIYHTTLGRELRHARRLGATNIHFKQIMKTEDRWIEKQNQYLAKKYTHPKVLNAEDMDSIAEKFPPLHFTPEVAARYKEQEKNHKQQLLKRMQTAGMNTSYDNVKTAIRGKFPIFISGAVHDSWGKIPDDKKQEIKAYLSLLVDGLSPENIYFITSGTDLGITHEFYAQHAVDKGFTVIGAFTDAMKREEIADNSVTHALFVGKDWFEKGAWIAKHLKKYSGEAIIASGGSVTEDEILYFYNEGISMHLMRDVGGASSRKALSYPDTAFSTASELMLRLDQRLSL